MAEPAFAEPRLEFFIKAAPSEEKALNAALDDALVDFQLEEQRSKIVSLNLEVILSPPESNTSLARLWIASSPSHLDLYVTDAQRDRVFIRRLRSEGRSALVRFEELSQVVRAVVDALLEGAAIGLTLKQAREEMRGSAVEQDKVEASKSAPPLPKLGVHAAAQMDVQAYSREIPLRVGLGLSTGFAFHFQETGWGLGLFAGYAPLRLTSQEITASLDALVLRALATSHIKLGGNWRLALGLGGGVDTMFFSPIATDPGLTASESRPLHFGALRAAVGVHWQTQHFFGALRAVCDLPLADIDFSVNDGTEPRSVLKPWPVQPGISLQIGIQ